MTETCFRHGLVKVDLMEQTPLAPDIGDCPTFAVPHSNVSVYKVNFSLWNRKSSNWWKVVLELQQAPLYRIYLFSRGWFYLKLMEGSLDYIEVKHGQHMSVHLALQVPQPDFSFQFLSTALFQQLQKIPIDSFFKSTVPEDTHDCEEDATFNFDEVPSAFF